MKYLVGFIFALVVSGCVVIDDIKIQERDDIVLSPNDGPGGESAYKWQRVRHVADSGIKKGIGFFPQMKTVAGWDNNEIVGLFVGVPLINVCTLFIPTIGSLFVEPFSNPDKEPCKVGDISSMGLIGMYGWRAHPARIKNETLQSEDVIRFMDDDRQSAEVASVCGVYLASPGGAKLKADVEQGRFPRVAFNDPLRGLGDNVSVRIREFKKAEHVSDGFAFSDISIQDEELVKLFRFRNDCDRMITQMTGTIERVEFLASDFPDECRKLVTLLESRVIAIKTKRTVLRAEQDWLNNEAKMLSSVDEQIRVLEGKRDAKLEAARVAAEKKKERLKQLEEMARKVARADLR